MRPIAKILILLVGAANLGVFIFLALQLSSLSKEMPHPVREAASLEHGGHGEGGEHGAGHGEASGHAAASAAHGAPAGHGAPAEGHGAPAGGHGAPAEGGHGTASVSPAHAEAHKNAPAPRSWVSFDEMFVNINGKGMSIHTLAFKLEVELFDESSRKILEQRQAVVQNAILEVARNQPYDFLQTLAGKLYFKEALTAEINQTVRMPLIRDMHLASFALQ